MLMVEAPNIFIPRNNWNIACLNAKAPIRKGKSVEAISKVVQGELGVSPLVNVKYRGGIYRKARQIFIEMLCRYSVLTQTEIGAWISKSHCTVITSRRVVANELQTNKEYRDIFNRIEDKIKAL